MKRIFNLNYKFARSRMRRQMKFDPKLKNFTITQTNQNQIDQLRQQFQSQNLQNLSQILDMPQNKLKKSISHRFHVDRQQLQNKIRKVHKQQASLNKLQQLNPGELNFLQSSGSHIYDQAAQIQFQKQFKKRLFYKKEVARLIQKKNLDIKNHIDSKKDLQYIKYLQNKKQLKNRKINNMMGFNKNNEQLQLLISSGIIDNPQKFKQVIQRIQKSKKQQENLKIQYYKNSNLNLNQQNQGREHLNQRGEHQNQHNFTKQLYKKNQLQTLQYNNNKDQQLLTSQQQQKIAQIIQNYQSMHQKDQQNYKQQINILYQIKQYQNKIFLQRYNAINFRFKGQTKFTHFNQLQMKNYVKHINIQPKDLLTIFRQNQNRISKLNLPVITPTVMATIYAKTSFYVFPQNLQNNRINMLNSSNFIYLEKKLFKSLQQLDNTSFSDAVWAYAKNHEEQSGLLKPQMSKKIQQKILQQLSQRIASLNQQDLGLCMRALIKLPIKDQQQQQWDMIIQVLEQKLPKMQQSYEIQSVLNFISLIPKVAQSIAIVRQNFNLLKKYQWQFQQSLTTFIRISSYLMNSYSSQIQQFQKIKKSIYSIIKVKFQNGQLKKLIPDYSLNKISFFNALLVRSQIQIKQLNNYIKKYAIQRLKLQKQQLNPKTLSNLTMSFALLDYFTAYHQNPTSLRTMLPGRVLIFNSAKYFVYHQLARFSHSQLKFLNSLQISRILLGCSISQYKNQGLYDSSIDYLMRKIEVAGQQYNSGKQCMQVFMNIIHCYSLQKRTNHMYHQVKQRIFKLIQQTQGKILLQIKPNDTLSFVVDILNLEGNQLQQYQMNILNQMLKQKIQPYIGRYLLSKQDLISFLFVKSVYLGISASQKQKVLLQLENYYKDKPYQKFSLEQLFIINLSTTKEEYSTVIKTERVTQTYNKIQSSYYERISQQMLRNQQHIGTPFNYHHVMQKFKHKIQHQYPNQKLQQLPWRIQIPQLKKVYFFATYDHTLVKQQILPDARRQGRNKITIFGAWRAFHKNYKEKGWQFNVIYTFLQNSSFLQVENKNQ